MTRSAALALGASGNAFNRFLFALDRMLLRWHDISTRNGDVARYNV